MGRAPRLYAAGGLVAGMVGRVAGFREPAALAFAAADFATRWPDAVFLAAGRAVVGDKQCAAGGAARIRCGFFRMWFHPTILASAAAHPTRREPHRNRDRGQKTSLPAAQLCHARQAPPRCAAVQLDGRDGGAAVFGSGGVAASYSNGRAQKRPTGEAKAGLSFEVRFHGGVRHVSRLLELATGARELTQCFVHGSGLNPTNQTWLDTLRPVTLTKQRVEHEFGRPFVRLPFRRPNEPRGNHRDGGTSPFINHSIA